MPLEPGQKLSHYRLIEKIGEGGMGVVWKARDEKLRRDVALKVLPAELVEDPERRRRLLREARSAAAINHPNIGTVHEVDEAEGTVFIAMELVEGKTLRVLLGGKPLAIPEALRIATEIAEGLAAAHGANVIHRDLKPENILVRPDGHVKILDFGLAKIHEKRWVRQSQSSQAETVTEEMTREGRILGTPAYMSPEQARGDPVDTRSDIFSFGSTVYEMVTGRAPFEGRTNLDTLSAILNKPASPPSQLNADVPPELERILGKCLEKEPKERYHDTEDVAVDLRQLRGTSGTTAPVFQAAQPRSRRRVLAFVGALVALAAVFGYVQFGPRKDVREPKTVTTARKMTVVLPFENLGPPDDAYFAAGMTDEITSRLAMVSGLGVISRTSASQYDRIGKSIKKIGKDFGVEYVLDGTVRWARDAGETSRVRITLQLVRVADDTLLWAQAYDAVIDEIFQVQTEIAKTVIQHLQVTLLESERTAVEAEPTNNPEAYQAYLRGQYYEGRAVFTKDSYELAIQMFQRAIELDPGFALAYAGLSRTHGGMYLHRWDRTETRRALAKQAIDKAVALAPESPEVHLYLGYYYYRVEGDFERALEEYALVEKVLPRDPRLLEYQGAVFRRQGQWEKGLEYLERAYELNPRYARIASDVADTNKWLRRYIAAGEYYDRATALAPDELSSYSKQVRNLWNWKGSTKEAQAVLESMPEVDHEVRYWQEIYQRKYQEALDRASVNFAERWLRDMYSAFAYDLLDEQTLARESYDAARIQLEEAVPEQPQNFVLLSMLGIAYAGLDRKEDAIRIGKKSIELHPISKDAVSGTFPILDLARIYTMVGEYEKALDLNERLLSIPSDFSIPLLQLDPLWGKPLWDHPRFQELVERYGNASK